MSSHDDTKRGSSTVGKIAMAGKVNGVVELGISRLATVASLILS